MLPTAHQQRDTEFLDMIENKINEYTVPSK